MTAISSSIVIHAEAWVTLLDAFVAQLGCAVHTDVLESQAGEIRYSVRRSGGTLRVTVSGEFSENRFQLVLYPESCAKYNDVSVYVPKRDGDRLFLNTKHVYDSVNARDKFLAIHSSLELPHVTPLKLLEF